MNYLVINQPLNNRGDESAHRGFIRALIAQNPTCHITCLFIGENEEDIDAFRVSDNRVQYVNIPANSLFRKVAKIGIFKPTRWIWYLHPTTNRVFQYYKSADVIVCAPGGADLGGFLSWKHLAYLYFAIHLHKSLAYFGRSFGPLRDHTLAQRVFRQKSIEALKQMKFISLRDGQSQAFAHELDIPFTATIDSAFLEDVHSIIPSSVQSLIGTEPYIVFVPNLLTWHYNFAGRISEITVRSFFVQIGKLLRQLYPHKKIVMLPQLFGARGSDYTLFQWLAHEWGGDNTIVLPDTISSDIQQSIIAHADLMIGARYHSVVFAIHNATPLVALCYEHKISGLLASLNKTDCMVDLIHGLDSEYCIRHTLSIIQEKIGFAQADKSAATLAHTIAHNGLEAFIKHS